MPMTMHLCRKWPLQRTIGSQLCKWYNGSRQLTVSQRGLAQSLIEISDHVLQAIRNDEPVVALESTIITHGMPYPENLNTALKVESTIKAKGAIPATIGIIKGRIHVGLTGDQLELLAAKKEPCLKTSRRDFPYVLGQKLNGGTTVSGTMLVAAKAGIPIFVTGGIGGVHRGAEESFDVSADLTELGRTSVAVISSGIKSILDIGKTLEYLETQGVCVATLGATKDFPAFFSPSSGFQAPYCVETTLEAARLIHHSLTLGTASGLLIAVPIPESSQADGQTIERAIQTALALADDQHVRGRDVTPFVLSQVNRLTSGASLAANMALIEHNASVGAGIAVDLARIRSSATACSTTPPQQRQAAPEEIQSHGCSTVVIGGSVVDVVVSVEEDSIKMDASTHRGSIWRSYGGVGRNLADALTRLGHRPLFVSVVGDDESGRDLIHHNPAMESRGVLRLASTPTASYVAILDNKGDYKFGVGDMKIHQQLTVDKVKQFEEDILQCRLLIMDGNLEVPTMEYILDVCRSARVPVWYEPTDVHKASKPFRVRDLWSAIAYTSPNLAELKQIVTAIKPGSKCLDEIHLESTIEEIQGPIISSCQTLLDSMDCVMITLGKLGTLIVRKGETLDPFPLAPWRHDLSKKISSSYYRAPVVENIVSVSGAGDCLAAGFIAGILQGWDQNKSIAFGINAAACSLEHPPAVPSSLSNLSR